MLAIVWSLQRDSGLNFTDAWICSVLLKVNILKIQNQSIKNVRTTSLFLLKLIYFAMTFSENKQAFVASGDYYVATTVTLVKLILIMPTTLVLILF